MKQEVYSCDICKKPNAKEHLSNIVVRAEGIHFKNMQYSGLHIDICDECLRKKGIQVERKTDEEEIQRLKQNEICLEDKVTEFLRDLGVIFGE